MGHMKKQQLKIGIFAVTISVLLISMGNLPIATAGTIATTVPQATMTVDLFCDLQAVNTNVDLAGVNPNEVVPFSFDLVNTGNGQSTASITGAPWVSVNNPADIILVVNTSYEVNTNAVGPSAFDGNPQPLGIFDAGEGAETVDLIVTVNLITAGFTGDATLDMTVTDSCA